MTEEKVKPGRKGEYVSLDLSLLMSKSIMGDKILSV